MIKTSKLKQKAGELILAGLITLTGFSGIAKAEDLIATTSEISYNNKLEFRLKPSYNSKGPKKSGSLEFMAGKSLRGENYKLGIYGDVKTDSEDNFWAGVRGEGDYKIPKTGTNLGLQLRHFSGLKKESKNHFYLIPYVTQDLGKGFKLGAWDYIKQNYEGKKRVSYLGPFLIYSPSKNLSFLFHYGKDLHGSGNLIYGKIGIRLGK